MVKMLQQLAFGPGSSVSGVCLKHAPVFVTIKRGRNRYQGKKQKQYDEVRYNYQNVPDQPNDEFEPGEFSPRRLTYRPEYLVKQYTSPMKRPDWYIRKLRLKEPLHNVETEPYLESEYREEAVYPKILKDQKVAPFFLTCHRTRMEWYDKIKALPTSDEKNFEMSPIPRMGVQITPLYRNFGELKLYQRLTRTHLIRNQLPESYQPNGQEEEDVVQEIKPHIMDCIRFHMHDTTFHSRSRNKRVPRAQSLLSSEYANIVQEENMLIDLNDIIVKGMVSKYPHLIDTETAHDDDIRSWWYADQLNKPFELRHWKLNNYDKIDQMIMYHGYSPLQIRTSKPLPRILPENDALCTQPEVPEFEAHPWTLRYQMKTRYPTCSPGIWPDLEFDHTTKDPHDFPFMSVMGRRDLNIREAFHKVTTPDDDIDVLTGKAIMSSFGWLNGLASNQGFTPFHEITYPFINQGWISDGQRFMFFVYQMNAHTFHSDLWEKDKRNLCWVSPEMMLYEKFEDGEFHGVNDNVLRQLVKMYSMQPAREDGVEYRPYLGEDKRTEEDKVNCRFHLRRRSPNYHEPEMKSWRFARVKPFFFKTFVENPDYDTKLWRLQIIPRLKPAEPFYRYWKY